MEGTEVTGSQKETKRQSRTEKHKTLVRSDWREEYDEVIEVGCRVVAGAVRDYSDRHPQSALLVVEVTDRTLAYDRDVKGSWSHVVLNVHAPAGRAAV